MATQQVLQTAGTNKQLRFFVTGSFSPADAATNWTMGTPTDRALTLAAVADAAGRQSLKMDIGTPWAREYDCFGCVDFALENPSATGQIDYYWAPSTHATDANGNVAGNSGLDADCPGGALGSITLLEFLKMCIPIGSLFTHDGASVQNGYVGRFEMPTQWGQLIVVNNGGDVYENDDVEMHTVLNPVIPDIAAAA